MTNKPKTETENSVQHDKEEVGKELLLLAERQQTEKLQEEMGRAELEFLVE